MLASISWKFILLVALLCSVSSITAFQLKSLKNSRLFDNRLRLFSKSSFGKRAFIGGLIAAGIFSAGAPAFADLGDEDEVTSGPRIIMVTTTTSGDDEKPKKKVAVDEVEDGDDINYSNSLKKERAKQDARKKSKTARAKDLCESLGRGC
jgi:hypothetical protein